MLTDYELDEYSRFEDCYFGGDDHRLLDISIRVDTSKLTVEEECKLVDDIESVRLEDEFDETLEQELIQKPECEPKDPDANEWIYGCIELVGEVTQWTLDKITDVFCKYDVDYSGTVDGLKY